MKRLRMLSDVSTSRGIFLAGSDVALEDAEADSCIKNGHAVLVAATAAPPPKPTMPANVVLDPSGKTKKKL